MKTMGCLDLQKRCLSINQSINQSSLFPDQHVQK